MYKYTQDKINHFVFKNDVLFYIENQKESSDELPDTLNKSSEY